MTLCVPSHARVFRYIATEDLMSMNNEISELRRIHTSGVLPVRHAEERHDLRLHDPAPQVMTDFTTKFPITVAPERQIDAALADMIRFGVRALLVAHDNDVVGLITSYDIEGPRPERFRQRSNLTGRERITVGDIMTQWQDLPTVDWQTVRASRIADILEIFQGVGVMHLLVVEGDDADGHTLVRGLICRRRIERQLDGSLDLAGVCGDARMESN
jgi:CBS domain-containing protein